MIRLLAFNNLLRLPSFTNLTIFPNSQFGKWDRPPKSRRQKEKKKSRALSDEKLAKIGDTSKNIG